MCCRNETDENARRLGSKKFQSVPLYSWFWQQVPESKYPEFKRPVYDSFLYIYSTTCCCVFLVSVMKFVKSNHHATLTNEQLVELIRTFLTMYWPDSHRLSSKILILINNSILNISLQHCIECLGNWCVIETSSCTTSPIYYIWNSFKLEKMVKVC